MRTTSLLFALASACGLPESVDPEGLCVLDEESGWPVFNADEYEEGAISLEITYKDYHVDHTRTGHAATEPDSIEKETSRYILSCPQAKGEKAVKFVVNRPAEFTEFGAEWVQLFPKDSWANVTNEYEPFTFNQFGAKIPLLRESTIDGGDDGPIMTEYGNLTVYMVVDDIGDYEVMYGNPNFVNKYLDPECTVTEEEDCIIDRWAAVQFRSTLLRVGSPWADCDDGYLPDYNTYDLGTIIPAFFGHPNLNLQKYKDLATAISDSAEDYDLPLDVKVVLEIFDKDTKLYTMSEEDYSPKTTHPRGAYSSCYVAGNACPEDHSVCKAKYCELDTWEEIVRLFQAIPGVEVLGAVGVDTTSDEYDILDEGSKVSGFFYKDDADLEDTDNSVYLLGEPLFERGDINATDTFVTLADSDLGVWNPFSWYPHVPNKKWAAIVDNVTYDEGAIITNTLFDRGYGYVFVTDQFGFNSSATYITDMLIFFAYKRDYGDRRLQDAETAQGFPQTQSTDVTYSWGCDDTRYHCSPVCLAQNGPVTTIAADAKCADAPMDPCGCKCYYDAKWTCSNGEVVCMATKGIETMVVGDMLCENRGTPKPTFEELSNTRQAGECEPVPTTRGKFPAQQCLTQWATTTTPEPEPEEEEEEEASTVAPVEEEEDVAQVPLEVTTSFAAAATLLVALSQ